MIEARLADGTILSFPDGADQAVVDRVVKQHVMGAAPQDQIDTFGEKAEDVGRAAAAGLGRGAIGLLELPEMAGRLGVRTYQEAKQLLGGEVEEEMPVLDTATGRALRSGVEALGLEDELAYRGQTRGAKFAGTIGEFLPSAIGGPAGLARRAATATVAGAGSEAAGQVAEGTALEAPARLFGALLSPSAAAKAAMMVSPNKTLQFLRKENLTRPTVKTLEQEKNRLYDNVKAAGITFGPDDADDLIELTRRAADAKGYYDKTDRATKEALDFMEDLRGETLTLDNVDKVRRELGKMGNKAKDEPAIFEMMSKVDEFIIAKAGDNNLLAAARDANSKWSKLKTLEKEFDKAKRGAAKSGSGGNIVNRNKQAVDKILNNPRKIGFFSDDEVKAMRQFVERDYGTKVGRILSKMSPTSGGLSAMLNIGAVAANPALIGLSVAGFAAKSFTDAQILRAAERLKDLTASGGVAKKWQELTMKDYRDAVLEIIEQPRLRTGGFAAEDGEQ